jgi:hypothetical protein
VTAHDRGSAFEGEVAPRKDETGVRLSKRQIDELLVLLNDEENYTDMATCHHPRHEYVFRDSRGEAQATVGVSDDCATLDAWPEIPAQHRRGGNIVRPKLRRGMARLCNQLKLEGCPPPESFERQ